MTSTPTSVEGPVRVAVVGSGAWGTTLALIVARSEPVTLLSHSQETAARIAATSTGFKRAFREHHEGFLRLSTDTALATLSSWPASCESGILGDSIPPSRRRIGFGTRQKSKEKNIP